MERHQRKPWAFEKYYIVRNTYSLYTNVSVTGSYNRKVTPELLSVALREVVLQNVQLTLNSFRKNGQDADENGENYVLRPVDRILFNDVVSFASTESIDETITKFDEIVFSLNEEKCLWHVFVHDDGKQQYVSFVYDHLFLDGKSGVQFHRDLILKLSAMDRTSDYNSGTKSVIFDYETDKESLPDIHKPANVTLPLYKVGLWDKVSIIASTFFVPQWYKNWFYGFSANPFYSYKKAEPHVSTVLQHVTLTPVEMATVQTFCKLKNLSVSALFLAVTLEVLQRDIFSKMSDEKYSTKTKIVVCGRRYVEDASIFNYGTPVCTADKIQGPICSHSDILRNAAEMTAELRSNLKTGWPFKLVGMLEVINVWKFFELQLAKKDYATLEVSNMGLQRIQYGDWRVEDLNFRLSIGPSQHFLINAVATESGINLWFGARPEYSEFFGNVPSIFKQSVMALTESA